MATLGQLGNISGQPWFQDRIAEAMAEAAVNVYGETYLAPASATAAAGTTVISFSGGVPVWVTLIGIGGTISDLTVGAALVTPTTITGATATTITIAPAVQTGGVLPNHVISFNQHAARASFANRVANGNYSIKPICDVVLGNGIVASSAVFSNPPDYSINDIDIGNAVASVWNMFAGA